MGDLNTSWHCLTCGMPNFSPVLNSTHTGSLSDEGDITLGSISPGAPLAMSSPIPPKRKDNRHHKPPLKLLNVNCRSISDKKGQFQHLIDSTVPDIVVATETWLKPEQGDGEIGEPGRFSADYTIHRRDRPGKSKGGGVFITVKNDLRSTRCEELEPEEASMGESGGKWWEGTLHRCILPPKCQGQREPGSNDQLRHKPDQPRTVSYMANRWF